MQSRHGDCPTNHPVEKIKIVKADKLDNLIQKIPWIVAGLICLVILAIVIALKFFR